MGAAAITQPEVTEQWTPLPMPDRWNKLARSWLGVLPDQEISRLTGKKLKTVQRMRFKLGIRRVKVPALPEPEQRQLQTEYAQRTLNQYELAVKYDIHQSTVSRIVNRWGGQRRLDCGDLKSETLAELARVWGESRANGTQDCFGIWTKSVNTIYRLTWRDVQAKREGVLCTTASWQDLDAISLAVWLRLKQLRDRQQSFQFSKRRSA